MNKQRIKDMAMATIVTTLVVGVTPVAFAKVSKMDIPVSFNNIKVVVDGTELKTEKEPFIYDGTTYLPVRAVAEAVGKDVKWDSATQTVSLSVKAETPAVAPEGEKKDETKAEKLTPAEEVKKDETKPTEEVKKDETKPTEEVKKDETKPTEEVKKDATAK